MAGKTNMAISTAAIVKFPARPKPSTIGQPAKIGLNTYTVESMPADGKDIYQYDVVIGNGAEKRGLMKKVWQSAPVQKALPRFIWDGNLLAWSMTCRNEDLSLVVDMDKEQGRAPRPNGKKNEFRIIVRRTKNIRFAALTEYMNQRTDMTPTVLECVNFFDHLLREHPSSRLVQIKRSFFQRSSTPTDLGSAVEAFKGVYQSLRIVHMFRGAAHGARLSVNLDVANGTFWHAKPLHLVAVQLCGKRDVNDLIQAIARGRERSREAQALLKFRKLRVTAKHRGKNETDHYTIQRVVYTDAKTEAFEKDGKRTTIYDYFVKQYGIRLQYPTLPLVETTKKARLPMEILTIEKDQRYLFKLDEKQTSNMIRFAATPPAERYESISHGIKMLDWNNDPVLRQYGVRINPNKTMVDARILPAPKVQFGVGEARPGTSGRWDLKGKKFLTTNVKPLKAWSVCVVSGRVGGKPDTSIVQNFMKAFIQGYIAHGGKVENKQPAFVLASSNKGGEIAEMAWNAAGNQSQCRPQMLVFVLPDKNSELYNRIKRSCECRYGVVSQCVQYAHVTKCQPQYISNVCMKFNAKLGGSTARAVGAKAGPAGMSAVPTMIIGADVSHAAPGSQVPSMAALTVSMDKLGVRYAAACQTNGHRVEMITTSNIEEILHPLLTHWKTQVSGGKYPQRVFYFRDGVSDQQYHHVLAHEVKDMKALFQRVAGVPVQFVVIVGSKRHHVRFFPERGDRTGNALPGTLVETGVTHPFENDFYLCSHAAIKGTARPAHYHVLLNEPSISNDELHAMLYEHCYQYIRSTTPVSQHPAMYYAHLAAGRAVCHDPTWANSTETPPDESVTGTSASGPVVKLMDMPPAGDIRESMWYV